MATPILGALYMSLLVSVIEACQLGCKSSLFTKRELNSTIDLYQWNSYNEEQRKDIEKLTIQPSANPTLPKTLLKLFPSLRIINASCANLSSVGIFEDNGSNVLETLLLSSNNISQLTDTPFLQLNHLRFLNLSHNKFTQFKCEYIVGLHNLVILDLSYNPNLDSFKCHFMYVPSLKQLALNNNKLVTVNFTISHSRLQQLNLENNQLVSFDFLTNNGTTFAFLESLNILKNIKTPTLTLEVKCLQMDGKKNNNQTCPLPFAPMLELPVQSLVTIEEAMFLLMAAFCMFSTVTILVLASLWCQKSKSCRHITNDDYSQQAERKSSFEPYEEEITPEAVTYIGNTKDVSDKEEEIYVKSTF